VTKKDYNLMLSHIEKIHEATLVYCALWVLSWVEMSNVLLKLYLLTEIPGCWLFYVIIQGNPS
jgi:hypothetical protein